MTRNQSTAQTKPPSETPAADARRPPNDGADGLQSAHRAAAGPISNANASSAAHRWISPTAIFTCRPAEQLEATIAKYFVGQSGLMIAEVDLIQLGDTVRWEPARGGDLFPHTHAELPMHAVVGLQKRD